MSNGETIPEEKPAPKNQGIPPTPARYTWQTDPGQAARQLALGLEGSSAHAALMINKKQLWAHAGSLDEAASQKISAILARYLDSSEKGDLARFVRLDSTKTEYMVYATTLVDDLALALVFDASTPLTQIRSQVFKLARALKQTEAIHDQAVTAPAAPPAPGMEKSVIGEEALERVEILNHPETGREDISSEGEEGAPLDVEAQISLSELLANMPSPAPGAEGASVQDWILSSNETKAAGTDAASAAPGLPSENKPQEPFAPMGAPLSGQFTPAPGSSPVSPEEDSGGVTQPLVLHPLNHLSDLEPVSPSFSRLTYVCLMIPRLPHHYLVGELAEHLAQWFRQYSVAYGWRLESISIRPEYVQWMVKISPTISPGNMIRILRQVTSQHIFSQNAHLKNENPSGDFWAPGYLIVNGLEPPTTHMRLEFIDKSRRRQGVLR